MSTHNLFSASTFMNLFLNLPAPDHLVCIQNAEDLSLKVRWDAPNPDSGCTVIKYDIVTTIDVIWSGETFNNDSSVEASTTEYVVENPVPYSNYTFGVSAIAAGDVKGMTVNCGVTTAQTGEFDVTQSL
jgi:hypothetical protein